MKKTSGLVEQHIHGGFGVDLANCEVDGIIYLAEMLAKNGITIFFPTLVTDSIDNLTQQIKTIKQAKIKQPKNTASIAGIHLEGPFISKEKKGIHCEKHILAPSVDSYKKIEDDLIKIVTLAPELDTNKELCSYLRNKNIKVSAGHTVATDLGAANQVTHLFNAMGAINHKTPSTTTSALINNEIYTEVIADGMHITPDVLKLVFKSKPLDKILLISDSLPIAKSNEKQMNFCNEMIYLNENKITNKEGTLAGSAMILSDIIRYLVTNNILDFETAIKTSSTNQLNYHEIESNAQVIWDENIEAQEVKFN